MKPRRNLKPLIHFWQGALQLCDKEVWLSVVKDLESLAKSRPCKSGDDPGLIDLAIDEDYLDRATLGELHNTICHEMVHVATWPLIYSIDRLKCLSKDERAQAWELSRHASEIVAYNLTRVLIEAFPLPKSVRDEIEPPPKPRKKKR